MLTDAQREQLLLANDKADKLLRQPFLRVESIGVRMSWHRDRPVLESSVDEPSETEIDAFVLTARFFCQDRDGISFRRLDEDVYTRPGIPRDLAGLYRLSRDGFNAFLSSPTGTSVDGRAWTSGEVLDIGLYGDLAHVNADKRAVLKAWGQMQAGGHLMRFWFLNALVELASMVRFVRAINEQLLAADDAQTGP